MPTRRAFLGWTGVTGYGLWAALRPAAPHPKPPKPTTTTIAPTTTTVAGSGYSDVYTDVY